MQENCRKSCKLCNTHKCSADLIKSPKLINKIANDTIKNVLKLKAPPRKNHLNVLKKLNSFNSTESFRKRA